MKATNKTVGLSIEKSNGRIILTLHLEALCYALGTTLVARRTLPLYILRTLRDSKNVTIRHTNRKKEMTKIVLNVIETKISCDKQGSQLVIVRTEEFQSALRKILP
jgi:hypothetical protein